MRSGVRPGRQTEREERDSGVATVGVGSVARCALGGDRYTGTHQHKCHAHILDTANLHSSGVLTNWDIYLHITSAVAATILTAAADR